MAFDQFTAPIQRCLERINMTVADAIQGSSIQVVAYRQGERINLALVVGNNPVAMNFVSEEECRAAFDSDPAQCTPIDRFTRYWIQVVRVKLNDTQSFVDLNARTAPILARSSKTVA